jgi:hypothetical protein
MKESKKKDFLYQYIPRGYLYLTTCDKIKYKDKILKSDYLIKIINDILMKLIYNDTMDNKINLWSLILKENYGIYYNYYINYLMDINFMTLHSNYFTLKKSKTYIVNNEIINDIVKVKITDNILLKKHNKYTFDKFVTDCQKSDLPIDVLKKLRGDLYKVDIDYQSSIKYMEDLKSNNKIDDYKYFKNIFTIKNIYNKNIYFINDDYGRIHTNYTILKRDIRKKYLTIDGLPVVEIDIKNSQPLFLGLLLSKHMDKNDLEYKNYISLVSNGIFYEYFLDRYGELFINRNDIKIMIYKVFYGKNNHKSKMNMLFKENFPLIYDFIKKYKENNKSYKSLSHTLQKTESDFLFKTVIKDIHDKFPHVTLITIHDSIMCSVKHEKEIKYIFNNHVNNLKRQL